MSMSARVWVTASAVILAASITAATVFSSSFGVESSPEASAKTPAPPVPVFVSPAPVAFDLESDNPAEL